MTPAFYSMAALIFTMFLALLMALWSLASAQRIIGRQDRKFEKMFFENIRLRKAIRSANQLLAGAPTWHYNQRIAVEQLQQALQENQHG